MATKLAGRGTLVRGPSRRAEDAPRKPRRRRRSRRLQVVHRRVGDALRVCGRSAARTMTVLHLPTPRSWRRSPMDAQTVGAILDALAAAGVHHWIAGGWGVDALLGEQTRRHDDLDLVIGAAPVARQRRDTEDAKRALDPLGYRFERNDIHLGAWFVERIVLCHGSGRRVDLLPIDERPDDFFATGMIGEREVPCLSADTQLHMHTGYPRSAVDHQDVAALCDRLVLEPPRPERKMEPGWR